MKKLFSKYLQSVCTPEEFQKVTQWMANVEHNDNLSSMMRTHWDEIFRHEPDSRENEALWERIKTAIEREERGELQHRLKIYQWGLLAAAVIVAALVITSVMIVPQIFQPEKMVQSFTTTVPHGARTHLLLPDGSAAWLNSGSTLTYSSEFVNKRDLELEGEAYFEVKKSGIPFTVKTAMGNVEVTGTSFNVKSLLAEKEFEATVEEGTVNVSSTLLPQQASLRKGQQARLMKGKWEITKVETDLFTSWKDGKIIFRREYLPMVAKRLERWYNVKIELDDDPRLQEIYYTGTIEMESFSEVLELLKITASVNYTFNDKTRVIRLTYR